MLFCFLHGLTGERSRKTNIPLRSVMLQSIERPHVPPPLSSFFLFSFFLAAKLIVLAGAYKVAADEKKKSASSLSAIATMLAAAALRNMMTRLAERNLPRSEARPNRERWRREQRRRNEGGRINEQAPARRFRLTHTRLCPDLVVSFFLCRRRVPLR